MHQRKPQDSAGSKATAMKPGGRRRPRPDMRAPAPPDSRGRSSWCRISRPFRLIAKKAKAGQTNVQVNRSSTGGANESFSDAADQAEEAKSQETPRANSQASEEAEGTRREEAGAGALNEGCPVKPRRGRRAWRNARDTRLHGRVPRSWFGRPVVIARSSGEEEAVRSGGRNSESGLLKPRFLPDGPRRRARHSGGSRCRCGRTDRSGRRLH